MLLFQELMHELMCIALNTPHSFCHNSEKSKCQEHHQYFGPRMDLESRERLITSMEQGRMVTKVHAPRRSPVQKPEPG